MNTTQRLITKSGVHDIVLDSTEGDLVRESIDNKVNRLMEKGVSEGKYIIIDAVSYLHIKNQLSRLQRQSLGYQDIKYHSAFGVLDFIVLPQTIKRIQVIGDNAANLDLVDWENYND